MLTLLVPLQQTVSRLVEIEVGSASLMTGECLRNLWKHYDQLLLSLVRAFVETSPPGSTGYCL